MKTAVEWLEDTLYPYLNKEDKEYTHSLFNKAKEMERQQEKSNWIGGYLACSMKDHNLPYGKKYLNLLADKENQAEQYYNETFKSE